MTDFQESVSTGQTNTLAIVSLGASILSVLSLLLSLCIPCGLRFIALALGAVGLSRASSAENASMNPPVYKQAAKWPLAG